MILVDNDILLFILCINTNIKSIVYLASLNTNLRNRILNLTSLSQNQFNEFIRFPFLNSDIDNQNLFKSTNYTYLSMIIHNIKSAQNCVKDYTKSQKNRKVSLKKIYKNKLFFDTNLTKFIFNQALKSQEFGIVKDLAPQCKVNMNILESVIENPFDVDASKSLVKFYIDNTYYIKAFNREGANLARMYNIISTTTPKEALDIIKYCGSNEQKKTCIRILLAYFCEDYALNTLKYYTKRASPYIRDIILHEAMRANKLTTFYTFYEEKIVKSIKYCDNVDIVDGIMLSYDEKCRSSKIIKIYLDKIEDVDQVIINTITEMISMIKPANELNDLITLYSNKYDLMEIISHKLIQYSRLDVIRHNIQYCAYREYHQFLYESYQLDLLAQITPIKVFEFNNKLSLRIADLKLR